MRCVGDQASLAIVRTILTLAEMLGMDVIIEGIEEPVQLRRLQELGGRFVQGDYTIANIAFGVVMDEWSAELFIDNVTDESAAVYVDTQNFTPKVVTNRPRTVGLRLSYDF